VHGDKERGHVGEVLHVTYECLEKRESEKSSDPRLEQTVTSP